MIKVKQTYQDKLASVQAKRDELEALRKDSVIKLEKIAGMSAEEAKTQMIEALKEEAKGDAKQYIKDIVDEAKSEAVKQSKKIVIESYSKDCN